MLRKKSKNMSLNEAPGERELKVLQINSDIDAKKKMMSLGIQKDDFIIKMTKNNWGAILVRNISNGNSMVALGRGLAESVIVTYEN